MFYKEEIVRPAAREKKTHIFNKSLIFGIWRSKILEIRFFLLFLINTLQSDRWLRFFFFFFYLNIFSILIMTYSSCPHGYSSLHVLRQNSLCLQRRADHLRNDTFEFWVEFFFLLYDRRSKHIKYLWIFQGTVYSIVMKVS